MPRNKLTLALILLSPIGLIAQSDSQQRTYAMRTAGRIVGYQIETLTSERIEDRKLVKHEVRSLVKIELLGEQFDQKIDQTWWLDPKDQRVVRMNSTMTANPQTVEAAGELTDKGFVLEGGGSVLDPTKTVISPEFSWVRERGPQRDGEEVTFDYFVPEVGGTVTAKMTLNGERKLTVLGEQRRVREYRLVLTDLGTDMVLMLDDAYVPVRIDVPAMDMQMELAEPSVVQRIERLDVTKELVGKTNLDIDDPSVLTFVKVRVVVDATEDITVESLNTEWQSFAGKVVDGTISGVFTIQPPRPDGSGSPAFPVPEGVFAAAELQPYLQPTDDIQSDDPALTAKARELADGAKTCFEVVDRLARWSDKNIEYRIPGGGTAKRTFELRQGECGGHSRVLAAMLRSLGIPARTPMGGMYVPLYGGSFGQHMWTEVFLGKDIGWLPVDCTAGQPTYVDAGHIRLSDKLTAFFPKELEVLDWAPKNAVPEKSSRRTDAYPWPVDEPQELVWFIRGKESGSERFVYRGRKDNGHVFESEIELLDGRFAETSTTVVGDDGRVVSFRVERKAGGKQSIDVDRADGKATISMTGKDGQRSDDIDVPEDIFVLHNNNTVHFAIAIQRALLAKDEQVRIRMLHTERRSPLGLVLTQRDEEEITIGGEPIQAILVDIGLMGLALKVHVDEQGRLLRFHQSQGDVTAEIKR